MNKSKKYDKNIIKMVFKDKALRKSLMDTPHNTLHKLGLSIDSNVDIKILTNKNNIVYMVMPNEDLDNELENINVGGVEAGTISSIGSVGSASTASTIGSTFGSASCASTIGSAGSAS